VIFAKIAERQNPLIGKTTTPEDVHNVQFNISPFFRMKLPERRARFVYEAARIENESANRPINPEAWEKRDLKFRENMIRAVGRQCGKGRLTSPKKLHDAWVVAYEKMGWKFGRKRDTVKKTHPDMIPFSKLGRKEQEKDWVFFMLCEISRRID